MRAARRFFSKILQFLRRDSLDAKRAQFRNTTQCRLDQPQRRFFEYAQRSLPGSTHFLRAARRISDFFKIFNFFRVTSAENLRDIDANGVLFRIWTHFRLFQGLK